MKKYWNEFLKRKKLKNIEYRESFYFHSDENKATELLNLVLQGLKTATTSIYEEYEKTSGKLPEIGEYSIITDFDQNPKCIIQTTKVTILKYEEMTYELCKKEGEDDTLESWQKNHEEFFKSIENITFSKKMKIVFEEFKVVYK